MNYKISLEKGSKKHKCPQCNKTRYVRYVNNETNEHLEYKYGRCDRETSCGYFNPPNFKNTPFMQQPNLIQEKPVGFIDDQIPQLTLKQYNNNHLFNFLLKYFDEEKILEVFKKYNIGTSKKWNGSTVFWQTDINGKYRTGKIMLYNQENGKRVKQPFNHISWVHKALKIEDYNLKQCLFGLHLTNGTKNVIGIVESEKTAITLTLQFPNTLWLATGSKQNLKEELLKPIKHRKLFLFPDKGEIDDWQKIANDLSKKGYNILVNDSLERYTDKVGMDLADLVFDFKDNNLNNFKLSPPEGKLLKLYNKNSEVRELVISMDLTDEGGNDLKPILRAC